MIRRRRPASPSFAGFRFPPDVVLLAVRWYLRYGLSYRDVEELLAERGIDVDHVTIYRWVQRFTPLVIDAARPCRHSVGERWFVDETYVKVAGVWRYVYRAVDQHGQVIDVLVSKRRNVAAATKFFEAMLAGRERPREVTTDLAARACTSSCVSWGSTSRAARRGSAWRRGEPMTLTDSNMNGSVALTDRVRVVACPGDPSWPSCISVVRWIPVPAGRGLAGGALVSPLGLPVRRLG